MNQFPFSSDSAYLNLLNDIKTKFLDTRIRSAQTVNRNLIDFYWWLGEQIVQKQDEQAWGDQVVEQLSRDLKKSFPEKTGFSPQNLWKIRKFYMEYRDLPILSQLVREIPWSRNLVIITHVKDPKAREYYLLFYHRKLQALVAMELKAGRFKPEYAGKMNFYLNLLDDYVREPHKKGNHRGLPLKYFNRHAKNKISRCADSKSPLTI